MKISRKIRMKCLWTVLSTNPTAITKFTKFQLTFSKSIPSLPSFGRNDYKWKTNCYCNKMNLFLWKFQKELKWNVYEDYGPTNARYELLPVIQSHQPVQIDQSHRSIIDTKISRFMFTFKFYHKFTFDSKLNFQFLDLKWNTWSFEPHFSTDWTLKIFHMDFHGYSTPPSFIPSVLKSLDCVIESILDKS